MGAKDPKHPTGLGRLDAQSMTELGLRHAEDAMGKLWKIAQGQIPNDPERCNVFGWKRVDESLLACVKRRQPSGFDRPQLRIRFTKMLSQVVAENAGVPPIVKPSEFQRNLGSHGVEEEFHHLDEVRVSPPLTRAKLPLDEAPVQFPKGGVLLELLIRLFLHAQTIR